MFHFQDIVVTWIPVFYHEVLFIKSEEKEKKKLGENLKKCTSVYDYDITKLSQITTLGSYRSTGRMQC
jgi:hypothetical protein